jgi:hypothetical protein
MSDEQYPYVHDTHVPHEAETAEAIDAQLRRTSDHASIADIDILDADAIEDAGTVGGTYSQSEVAALRTELVAVNAALADAQAKIDELIGAFNEALAVLRDAELIPMPEA